MGKLCGNSHARPPRKHRSVENTKVLSSSEMRLTKSKQTEVSSKIDLKNVVKSSVKKEDILVCDHTPKRNRHQTRFRCSICYTFYSDILECSECNNYVCIFDVEKYIISVNEQTCPFCHSSPVVFTDASKDLKMVKHYFTRSLNNSKERDSEVDEYWKSHARFNNSIKFVAINDTRNLKNSQERLKIMALDDARQTITPMCMKQATRDHREESKDYSSRKILFQSPNKQKRISMKKVRKRTSKRLGNQVYPSSVQSSPEESLYFGQNNNPCMFVSSEEIQESQLRSSLSQALEPKSIQKSPLKYESTVIKEEQERSSFESSSSGSKRSSLSSSAELEEREPQERTSQECSSSSDQQESHPKVLSSEQTSQSKAKSSNETSQNSQSDLQSHWTRTIQVRQRDGTSSCQSHSENSKHFQYKTSQESKTESYGINNVGESIRSGSDLNLAQFYYSKTFSEESVLKKLPRMTNIKDNIKFENTGNLPKKIRTSLYNKEGNRDIGKFARSTVKQYLHPKNFKKNCISKGQNLKNTRLSSARSSMVSFNPFKENMLVDPYTQRKNLKAPSSGQKISSCENIENESINISKSDQTNHDAISKYVKRKSKNRLRSLHHKEEIKIEALSSGSITHPQNPFQPSKTPSSSSPSPQILTEPPSQAAHQSSSRPASSSTCTIKTISSAIPVVNVVPQMLFKGQVLPSQVADSEISSCNYRSTQKMPAGRSVISLSIQGQIPRIKPKKKYFKQRQSKSQRRHIR
ncbi:unnamed protein product [Moneuplotes crassus]|uniref:Uncharacterized protein n=1 Tax=Euplotes crassus TaxID=5936 RepID=A0AAD1Y692_EUPCR|nr:unnamed protein product [Moneuplotes crassus]